MIELDLSSFCFVYKFNILLKCLLILCFMQTLQKIDNASNDKHFEFRIDWLTHEQMLIIILLTLFSFLVFFVDKICSNVCKDLILERIFLQSDLFRHLLLILFRIVIIKICFVLFFFPAKIKIDLKLNGIVFVAV